MSEIDEFEEYLRRGNIYFYGAGSVAKRWSLFCSKRNIKIEGYVVTCMENNPLELYGKPVHTLEEWEHIGVAANQMDIVVALLGGAVKWLDEFIKKPVFKGVYFISLALLDKLKVIELADQYESVQNIYKIDYEYPRSEVRLGALIEKKTQLPLFRVAQVEGIRLLESLVKNATREKYEKYFGKLKNLPYVETSGLSPKTAQKEKVEVYIATSHLDKLNIETLDSKGYIPIQCGAALTSVRKGFITDNTGDNISRKNKDYSECTGLYWIWKNTSGQDYVGLCHYRRRLTLDDKSIQYLKNNDVDVVVTLPQFERATIYETFQRYLSEQDWILLKQKVSEYDIGYNEYFEKYETGHFYFPCNVNLWKRKWFDRYCAFAFEVIEGIEEYYKKRNIMREDRFAGYLFEQLPSLFIMFHCSQLNVACAEIEWVE